MGAITGDVGVTNARKNLLTRLIGMRYWVAFNQERAAQSFFRSVLCCSGPLAGYRRSVLERVWDRYIVQSYRGVACTYGDDRHLTNLVLDAGFDTLFVPSAHAITYAPEGIRGYLRQQLRWNKSFYRELLWTLPFMLRRSPYVVFDVLVQTMLPLLLTLALLSTVMLALVHGPAEIAPLRRDDRGDGRSYAARTRSIGRRTWPSCFSSCTASSTSRCSCRCGSARSPRCRTTPGGRAPPPNEARRFLREYRSL